MFEMNYDINIKQMIVYVSVVLKDVTQKFKVSIINRKNYNIYSLKGAVRSIIFLQFLVYTLSPKLVQRWTTRLD